MFAISLGTQSCPKLGRALFASIIPPWERRLWSERLRASWPTEGKGHQTSHCFHRPKSLPSPSPSEAHSSLLSGMFWPNNFFLILKILPTLKTGLLIFGHAHLSVSLWQQCALCNMCNNEWAEIKPQENWWEDRTDDVLLTSHLGPSYPPKIVMHVCSIEIFLQVLLNQMSSTSFNLKDEIKEVHCPDVKTF